MVSEVTFPLAGVTAFDPVQQSNGYGEAQPAAGGAGVREAVLYFAE